MRGAMSSVVLAGAVLQLYDLSTQPPLFCRGQAGTRAQMAVFLVTTFGLPLP